MRRFYFGLVFTVAVFLPKIGSGQAYQLPSAPPQVTAANASWQISGEPLFHAGSLYYPAGPTVFFDGKVMVRTGTYQGVPLFADTTLEPYSIVYVPIGRNIMRPYEKPRTGELAGTVGSRTPSFPIQRDVELSAKSRSTGYVTAPPVPEPDVTSEAQQPVATTGTVVTRQIPPPPPLPVAQSRGRRNVMPSLTDPRANAGVWIEFNGIRWRSAGQTVSYSSGRFMAIGEHRGFPVYRDLQANADEIYIPAVRDGALTRYKK